MFKAYTKSGLDNAIKIIPIKESLFSDWLAQQSQWIKNWIKTSGFKASLYSHLLLPNDDGQVTSVILILNDFNDQKAYANLARQLPSAVYAIDCDEMQNNDFNSAALGWGLGQYQFSRYKAPTLGNPQLYLSDKFDQNSFDPMVNAVYFIRDLINTPAEDLGPDQLAQASKNLGHSFGAMVVQTAGQDLLTKNYPAIYTVGRGSHNTPILVDLSWGNERHPKLTLVGKGVCFDSGGLDLKPSRAMALMKKDMAGAAHVLGLARLIMNAKLPVRLRVLIPAVENSIGGNAFRPGDIIKMRNGTSVEIGNTDAEGRLVLADALSEAVEERPDLVIDMASLTGAARVALGSDIPVFFSNNDEIANDLMVCSQSVQEMIWRLPLYQDYRKYLDSYIADINNNSSSPYGGAISAALFLESFIKNDVDWLHFDIMGWNLADNLGSPTGGEAMGVRAIFKYLEQRYQQ